MQHAIWLAFLICTNLAAAAASPAPTVVTLDVDLAGVDRWSLWRNLPQSDSEPGGIAIPADADAKFAKLGLKPGDIIRTENGRAVGDHLLLSEGELLLEVDRGGKTILLRLMLRGATRHHAKLTDDEFADVVDRTKHSSQGSPMATPLRAKGQPTGVRVIDDLLFIHLRLHTGDVVRTIGGKPTQTDADFVAALQNLRVGMTEIELERNGRRETLTVERDAMVDFGKIVKRSETAYDVPVAVRNALKDDFQMFTRKARVVPAVTAGKIQGVKLFDIAPGTMYDALGLHDDDTILDVNGHSIDTYEDALSTHTALETVDTITVRGMRRGKPFTITYTIR